MRQALNAIRRLERYPAASSGRGRPGHWNRAALLEASQHLKSAVVTAETMAIGVRKVDELLEVSPDDVRSTFFETIREIFYALRQLDPEDLTDSHLEEMMADADRLTNTLRKIEREIG